MLHSEFTKLLGYESIMLSPALTKKIAREGVAFEGGWNPIDMLPPQEGVMRHRDAMDSVVRHGEDTLGTGLIRNAQTDSHYDSGFKFGRKSIANQKGVLPQLIQVADLALRYSTQDFSFFDGLRLIEEQRLLVAKGMSKTMKSKHLKQLSGFAEAMDLVPVVGTRPVWDWQLIYPIVCAVDKAATELGFADNMVWGGAWDRRLSDFGGDLSLYEAEVLAYRKRHEGKDFIDGPHFEWRD